MRPFMSHESICSQPASKEVGPDRYRAGMKRGGRGMKPHDIGVGLARRECRSAIRPEVICDASGSEVQHKIAR